MSTCRVILDDRPCGEPAYREQVTCQGTRLVFCRRHYAQMLGGAPLMVEEARIEAEKEPEP